MSLTHSRASTLLVMGGVFHLPRDRIERQDAVRA
jgi:hypothetical protein